MKILLTANTDWYLYHFRLSLAKFLRDHQFEVVFVSPQGKYTSKILAEGFRWIPWNLGRKTIAPWRELTSILDIMAIIRKEKPDLIHNHTIKPVIYGSLAARMIGKQVVINSITGRGYVFQSNTINVKLLRKLTVSLYRLAVKNPYNTLIFENRADKQFFTKLQIANPERSYIIPGVGIDPDYYQPMPEPEGTPLVVFAGRLLWSKGVNDLIQAARLLHPKVNFRLALVGQPDPGNPTSIPEDMILSWVDEGVAEWWGWHEDIREVFYACHIITLPSLGEGLPTVLIEAAACQRPIIATDVPGCNDIVSHNVNGLLIAPNDPQQLAEALGILLSDRNLRLKMGKAGREIVINKFSTPIINSTTFELYNQARHTTIIPR
jgi:glycosyltransferase involved in cell wall biosynthesis